MMWCARLRMLEDAEGTLCLLDVLDVPKVIRSVLLCMLEVVEGRLCLLEVLEMLDAPKLAEVLDVLSRWTC